MKRYRKRTYNGDRILYELREQLERSGIKICGYIRLQHLNGTKINGWCSLKKQDCSYDISDENVTTSCPVYANWLEEKRRIKTKK